MTTPHNPGDILLEPATCSAPNGEKIPYELGTLFVPENRDDPRSRIIPIGFGRFKALAPSNAPPTFHLPGGPGSTILNLPTSVAHALRYRPVSDVVIFDQRGASERGEMLRFLNPKRNVPLDQPANIERATQSFIQFAHDAVADYAQKHIDLRGYEVTQCAADVNDLRRALGYEKISLVGNSFGSQWSFAIIRLFPHIVARALLSGVEPLDLSYDTPSLVLAALRRCWREAEKLPALQPWLPPGGLEAAAKQILLRLQKSPVNIPVQDPKAGDTVTITLGHEDFQHDLLQKAVDSPAFILSLFHHHYDDWALKILNRRRYHDGLKIIGPCIDTALGATADREQQLRSDPALEFVGQWNFHAYLATKNIWPTADVGDAFRLPQQSPIPILFHQGDWDLQTPIENTFYIAPSFPNSRTLIIQHGEHGTRELVAQNHPQIFEQILSFLRTGTMPNLPDRIALPIPNFTLPNFPNPAAKS